MHKVEYLPLAQADVLDAVNYLAVTLDAPQAAGSLLDALDHAVEQISRFPYASELYRTNRPMRDEIRKLPIKGFILYYAVFQNRVEIRRFLHGRRNRTPDIVTETK